MFKCIDFSSINSNSSRNITTTFSNFNDSITVNDDNDDDDDETMSIMSIREESNRGNRKCLSNFIYDKTYYKSTITEQVSYNIYRWRFTTII